MREKKHQKQLLTFLMLSLVSVVSVFMMAGESFAAMDCSSCHGDGINPVTGQLRAGTDMRPVDAAYRNISTGGVVGSHQSHMKTAIAPSPANGVTNCSPCHANGTYATGHRSGTIGFAAGVAYDKGAGNITFTNVTTVPVLGTCSTASCHANPYGAGFVQTPQWGTNTVAGCTGCHQGSNAITGTGPATGSHAKHNNPTCTACHATGTSATTQPGTNHIDGNIDALASLGYPQNKAKNTAGASCSTASCHANPYGTGTVATPNWGTNTTAGCAGCHTGTSSIGTTGPNTGSHAKHNNPTCTACHATGTSATTQPGTNHIDGNIDALASLGYPQNKAKNTAGASCSTASCHANPYGTGTVATPNWGTNTTAGCAGCHTGTSSIGTTGPNTGSHAKHNNPTCTACHATGTSATTQPGTNHIDGNIDALASLGYPQNKAKNTAGASCSTASCHANPYGTGTVATPNWGTNTTAGCAGCHTGTSSIGTTGPNTGSHAKHNNPTCTACHATGTSATTQPGTNHIDGNIDALASLGYPQNKAKNTAGASCSTASCHANPYGTGTVATPNWGTNTTAGCAGCHTGTSSIGTTGPNTGSHAKHNNPTCTACHATGTSATTQPGTNHIDGNIDALASLGYPQNKAKNTAGASCSTASCHANPYGTGTVATPNWGTNTTAGCAGCHTGTNAILATGPATGNHAQHNDTTCTDCHTAGTTATTAPSTAHNNGVIDVVGGYTVNKAKNTAGASCSTASCHANPVGTGSVATPNWGTSSAGGCLGCHTGANAITALGPNTGGHTLHMSRSTGVTCTSCHAAGTGVTTAPSTGHKDGDIDVTVGSYTANKTKGSGAATCSNISCHNSPAGHTPAFTAPAATWGANLTCGGCHTFPPAGTNHTAGDTACNSCHNNVKVGVVSGSTNTIFVNNALHMDGIVQGGACDACHGYPPVRSMAGRGTNASYSSARIQNYSGGGGVHDIAAHLSPTLKDSQRLGFSACVTCHPSTSHNQANATFGGFSTQFVQVVVDPKFKFDKNRPIVYTAKQSGTGKTTGTCNNVECHMQKSPVWSSETYTQRH